MRELEVKFEHELVERAARVRASKPPVELPPRSEFIGQTRAAAAAASAGE